MFVFEDKLKEECGLIGVYRTRGDSSEYVYYGLHALQHRGQESAGIAGNENGVITQYKGMGLVGDVFKECDLAEIKGNIAIGHVRYSTCGDSDVKNAQPLVANCKDGQIALAHNGNLVNAEALKGMLQDEGVMFMTNTDTEVIMNLLARNYKIGLMESLKRISQVIRGAYSLVITVGGKLIGMKDPYALRPLCIGKLEDGYVFASESCALDALGAELVREVEPGEIVIAENNELTSYKPDRWIKPQRCIFELIYFARPDSEMEGVSVYESRHRAGMRLAAADRDDTQADVVIGVPDSGIPAAIGYAVGSGVPYGVGLIKNKYIGRTFIQPVQSMREESVRIKLNALAANVRGKSVVLIDDSIVRGTTSKRIVDLLKKAGAKQVHFRVSSPPILYSCFFGIDTPSRKNLIAATLPIDDIRQHIGADSLKYLTFESMKDCVFDFDKGFCTGCFDGNYPMEIPRISKSE